jgi:hypothetical protein
MVVLILGTTLLIAVSHLLASTNHLQLTVGVTAFTLPLHSRVLVVLEDELAITSLLFNYY